MRFIANKTYDRNNLIFCQLFKWRSHKEYCFGIKLIMWIENNKQFWYISLIAADFKTIVFISTEKFSPLFLLPWVISYFWVNLYEVSSFSSKYSFHIFNWRYTDLCALFTQSLIWSRRLPLPVPINRIRLPELDMLILEHSKAFFPHFALNWMKLFQKKIK